MKNLVRVEILGREYTVKSDEGEERVKRIAEYVNEKLKRISDHTKTVSTLNVAILAAMDIANEYFEILEGHSNLTQKVEKIEVKSSRLIEMINSKIS
ncbi:MAG TPA: cell division protein ZapA [Thermodesulfobacteriota bacterium]|nr:cell division protein ZapA [Thermodesulfobacteriota bacterium]